MSACMYVRVCRALFFCFFFYLSLWRASGTTWPAHGGGEWRRHEARAFRLNQPFFFFVPVSRLQNRTGPLCGFGLFPVSDLYFSHRNRENEITVFILETNQEAAAGTSGSSRTEPRTPNLSSGSNVTFITSVCLTRTCPAAFRLRTDRPQQAAETPTKENI